MIIDVNAIVNIGPNVNKADCFDASSNSGGAVSSIFLVSITLLILGDFVKYSSFSYKSTSLVSIFSYLSYILKI